MSKTKRNAFFNSPFVYPTCGEKADSFLIKNHKSVWGLFSLYECCYYLAQFWQPFIPTTDDWHQIEDESLAKKTIGPKVFKNYHKSFISKFGKLISGKNILDTGCGSGEFISELQKRGVCVWKIDSNYRLVSITKEKFGLKRVSASEFANFFKKEDLSAFDFITCFDAFQYFEEPTNFLQSVFRKLKSERFVFLMEAINGRFRTNLIVKASGRTDSLKLRFSKKVLIKTIRLAAQVKEYLLGGLPAVFLWLFCHLSNRRGRTLVVSASKIL